MGWAVNADTQDLLSKHSDAGALRALLKSDGSEAFENQGPLNLVNGAQHSTGLAAMALGASLAVMLSF